MRNQILGLLKNNRIDYIDRGVNVRKGCVAIPCVFIG